MASRRSSTVLQQQHRLAPHDTHCVLHRWRAEKRRMDRLNEAASKIQRLARFKIIAAKLIEKRKEEWAAEVGHHSLSGSTVVRQPHPINTVINLTAITPVGKPHHPTSC